MTKKPEACPESVRPLRLEWMRAGDLTPHPLNWRRHTKGQRAALQGALNNVSWAGAALYNEQTQKLLDGHLRRDMMPPDEEIPVLVGSWTPEQERYILATLDPIAALAEADEETFKSLLQGAGDLQSEIQAVLDAGEDFAVADMDRATINPSSGPVANSPGVIKFVVSVQDVGFIEKAIGLTGERNRGKAFAAIARQFLSAAGEETDGP